MTIVLALSIAGVIIALKVILISAAKTNNTAAQINQTNSGIA